VMAWGSDGSGELGNDMVGAESDVPVAVSGLGEVVAIAAGHKFSLALLRNGTVMAWGLNQYGQLGDGSTANSDVPVAVSGLKGVVAISAGYFHSLALLGNGTVMAWGNGDYGELDDGSFTNSDVPVAMSSVSGVGAVSAGGIHSLILLRNGTVMACGGNEYGQLGDGTVQRRDVPVAVQGLGAATAISAGMFHSLALLGNGTVMAWGFDHSGQLGDGTTNPRPNKTPVAVSGLSGVRAISAGVGSATASRTNGHSLALLSNGTVMAWGGNEDGQLGNGSTVNSDVPVAVSGLSGVKGISAGGFQSLAYGSLASL
jgi:alpha-tubulin suppressor-like RCC1 family protein